MGILYAVPLNNSLEIDVKDRSINIALMIRWVSLSFIPCRLMLGVTFYITTAIAATPLFWVIPLSLYLVTFIITFAEKPLISHAWVSRNSIFFTIFPIVGFIFGSSL